MKPHAEAVQSWNPGMPNSLAAFMAKLITPSEIMHVTGGTSEDEPILANRSLNGGKQFFRVESQSDGISCDASRSDCGSPSGMVSNRKSGKPLTAFGPRDRSKRLWLYSVLTKVMWKPLVCRSLVNCSIGVTWPCVGYGTQTA